MESKHVCKFCKKSFPCGRSLGGHIRSHLIRGNGNASNKEPKLLKSGSGPGYELRENPKKTNKATDLNFMTSSLSSETEDGSGPDPNLARRSGFIGGNNSNSSVSEVVEPEEEEVAVAMSLIMLSRDVGKSGDISSFAAEFSDNMTLLQANNNKVKKKRREKIQGKSSVPGADSKNDSKKSDNLEVSASGHLQNGSKVKEFEVSANGYASNDQSNKTHESKNSVFSANDRTSGEGREKMELAASGHLQIGLKLKESEVSENGFASNDQIMKPPRRKRKITNPNSMSKKMSFTTFGQVKNGSKMKEFEVSENGSASNDQNNNQAELGFDDIGMGSEFLSNNSDKRSKFECNTCNKVFYSYQALGGHRASHKKLNGMIKPSRPLKLESNDRDFLSPPPSNDHHHHQQQQLLGEIGIGLSSSSSTSMKVAQKHECPICFRIFPSGQALGGHKRSHLLATNTSTNTTTNDTNKDSNVVGKSSSSEMREFLDLDLNLPPATHEEEATIPTSTSSSSNNLVGLIKPYWWVESHKHELLLGLISN